MKNPFEIGWGSISSLWSDCFSTKEAFSNSTLGNPDDSSYLNNGSTLVSLVGVVGYLFSSLT